MLVVYSPRNIYEIEVPLEPSQNYFLKEQIRILNRTVDRLVVWRYKNE